MSVLTAVALIVFIIEAQIPLPVPIPGAKLGLANAITLFALFLRQGDGSPVLSQMDKRSVWADDSVRPPSVSGSVAGMYRFPVPLTTANVFMILVCRILLGAAFTGRIVAFIYSITGGLLSFAAMAAMKRIVTEKQIWVCGAVGAVFHNIGQILAAMVITGTPSIAAYLPLLIIAGVITGIITGLIAQFTLARIGNRE